MTDIRMIAMDMDGTLLTREGKIPPENLRAMRDALNMGVLPVIASGRFPENVSLILQEAGLNIPVIGTNGCEIMEEPMGRLLFEHFMDADAARAAAEMLNAHEAGFFLFSQKRVTTSRTEEHHHSELSQEELLRQHGFYYGHGPADVRAVLETGVYKFFVPKNGRDLSALREELEQIPHLCVTSSSPNNIELMPEGVDKGTGIRELAGHLHIPLAQVMALGDQENDLPMLTCAGYGVAMGNAPEHVKQKARYVTARFDEFGVARAIEKFVLTA